MRARLLLAATVLLSASTAGCLLDFKTNPEVLLPDGEGGGTGSGGNGGTGATTNTGGAGGTTTSTSSSTTEPDPGCVPSEEANPVADKCGIFVSATKGSDAEGVGEGTKDKPVATLDRALELAAEMAQPVYMCAETFTGPLEPKGSALIYGGLDCANDWAYLGPDVKTEITAPADTIPFTVPASVTVEMHDMAIRAADALQEGGSSIAFVADSSSDVRLFRCDITSGVAMKGADGAPHPTGAADGTKGTNGKEACSADTVVTDASPTNECGEVDSKGGSGGVGTLDAGVSGSSGQPVLMTNFGLGDESGQCLPGTLGAVGATGAAGLGAPNQIGTIEKTGFVGVPGADGAPGQPGQGGGGGGAARGGASACNGKPGVGGASGGSGGSGGCGGLGGRGGSPGGASIAILSLGASFHFEGVKITAGVGGAGGNGGPGQFGGLGLGGGSGGTVPAGVMGLKNGCQGGPGGGGGSGGLGGGGLGGHAIGIAHLGTPPDDMGAEIVFGTAGKGGSDGMETVAGALGVAAALLKFD